MFGANYFGSIYFGQTYPALTVGQATWVSPANHASNIGVRAVLVFIMPIQAASALHFEIEIDTVNTFDSGNLRDITSWTDQTGWEYYNGSSWVAIPPTGVPTSFAGNQARYTIQSNLALGVWYRRVRGRVIA